MKTTRFITLLVFDFLSGQSHAQTTTPAATGSDRFAQFDKKADGMLTREGFPTAKIFDGADTDKDGFATLEEVQAYYRNRRGSK